MNITCPECGASMVLRKTAKFKYKNGDSRPFYGCSKWPKCDATHGAHPDGSPLGMPGTKEVKQARMDAHTAMEAWLDHHGHRMRHAYTRLEEHFGREIHIGELDKQGCQEVEKYFKERI